MSKISFLRDRVPYSKIEDEYAKDALKDDDRIYRIKEIIDTLDDTDKALLIMYADLSSMAKTGRVFCVSPATIHSNITRIRNIIKERL